MGRTTRHSGFTLIELFVVIMVVALLIGLLLPATAKARENAKVLKDAQLIRGHVAILGVAAGDHGDRFPTPGLLHHASGPGQGVGEPPAPEDFRQNHTAALYSALIARQYFAPADLVSPLEKSGRVTPMVDYDHSAYDPATGRGWDPAFQMDLRSQAHASYAHLSLCGERKRQFWRPTSDSTIPILALRGAEEEEESDHYDSITFDFISPRQAWVGNVCFADAHWETVDSFHPAGIQYDDGAGPVPDNIFAAEFSDGQAGADAFLSICTDADENFVVEVYDPAPEF